MKLCKVLFTALMLAGVAGVAQAQDQTLSAGSATGSAGGNVDLAISLDSASGNIQGWSWGIENDAAVATVSGVVDGSTTATVGSGGMPPAFNQVNLFANGWTVGVVIDFLGCCTLAPGTGYEMNVASYDLVGAAGDTTSVCFVETLGSPPTATVVVIGGASVAPATVCGSIEIMAAPVESFIYRANGVDGMTSDASVTATCGIFDEQSPARDSQGFSMGLGHDSAMLNVTAVAPTGDLAGLSGGTGPSFFGENLLANGWTVGVVYSFLGGVFLQFDVEKQVVEATYDVVGSPADGDCTALTWRNDLGSPPVANVVVVNGQSEDAVLEDGEICFTEVVIPQAGPFIRGDANQDLIVNIADGIYVIGYMFYGYSTTCVAALNANNDAMVDLGDAMYIINWRFLDGPAPTSPFPACGISMEAGDVALGCDDHACP